MSGAMLDRCTAAVGATPTGSAFPAPHKPECAKLRKPRTSPHRLAGCIAKQSSNRPEQSEGDRATLRVHARAGGGRSVARIRIARFSVHAKTGTPPPCRAFVVEAEGLRARPTWRAGSTLLSFPCARDSTSLAAMDARASKRIHASVQASTSGPCRQVPAGVATLDAGRKHLARASMPARSSPGMIVRFGARQQALQAAEPFGNRSRWS